MLLGAYKFIIVNLFHRSIFNILNNFSLLVFFFKTLYHVIFLSFCWLACACHIFFLIFLYSVVLGCVIRCTSHRHHITFFYLFNTKYGCNYSVTVKVSLLTLGTCNRTLSFSLLSLHSKLPSMTCRWIGAIIS